jgi:hypothetical protein
MSLTAGTRSIPPDKSRGCLLGLAVGDAIGTTVEFRPRGSFEPLTDMVGGGPFQLRAGQWTDDTSMALCLAASLVHCRGFDARDQMTRYLRWLDDGYMSSTGRCFDVGIATRAALERFRRASENLYHRVRALFFLYAIHRFYLPRAAALPERGSIPYDGYTHLLNRRFEEAIKTFLAAQAHDGPSDSLSSALTETYHRLGFQTLADQLTGAPVVRLLSLQEGYHIVPRDKGGPRMAAETGDFLEGLRQPWGEEAERGTASGILI